MNARRNAIVGVVIMSVLLVLYFVLAGARAIALLITGTWLTIAMGVALLVLPLIGLWALGRELMFGYGSTKLVDRLELLGLVPETEIETTPSGRPAGKPDASLLEPFLTEVVLNGDSWQAWARLGIMHDVCGQRTEARAAMRRAISLERADTAS